jgi:hypothetical protein
MSVDLETLEEAAAFVYRVVPRRRNIAVRSWLRRVGTRRSQARLG